MGKFIKYVVGGLLAAYAVHGGCDKNIDDVLEDKYSTPIIAARRVAVNFVYKKINNAYKAVEKEKENLEGKVNRGEK